MIKAANPVRIVQVSDTHVSRKRPYFVDNWDVFVEEMRRQPADFIVHAGDVSFDGADDEDDIAFARREKDRLRAPWIAIPGNHDVGKSPLAVQLGQPVNAERMARWRRHYGDSRWCRDVGSWRPSASTRHCLEAVTRKSASRLRFWSDRWRSARGTRSCCSSTCRRSRTSRRRPAFTTMAVPAAARTWLLNVCLRNGVAVIAGHLHVYRRMEYRGIEIVWAPATSFFNIVEKQRRGLGVPRAGYVGWTLKDRAISHRLVEPPLMITHDVGAWNAANGSTTKMPPRPLVRP